MPLGRFVACGTPVNFAGCIIEAAGDDVNSEMKDQQNRGCMSVFES